VPCRRLLEEEGALFSGDNILGAGTVIVPVHGGDMRLYLASLALLLHDTPGWSTIYPGHGPPIADGRRAVADYIGHRTQREQQILQQLARGGAARAQSAGELVQILYRDRPLTPELRAAATENVYRHLVLLREKGTVCTDAGASATLGARWTRCG
jgi:ribonuclease/clavin/mitogillin